MIKTILTVVFSLLLTGIIFGQKIPSPTPTPTPQTAFIEGTINTTDAPTTVLLAEHYVNVAVVSLTTFVRKDVTVNPYGFYQALVPVDDTYAIRPYIVTRGRLQFPRTNLLYIGQDVLYLDENTVLDFDIWLQAY